MNIFNLVIVIVLIALSGLFSGLTLGLMSLKPHELRRKMRLGSVRARKIFPVRKRGNLLLTTLLLGNVAVNTALAVFLGSLTAGIIAGLVATGLIVIFGEIIPQAVISRHALRFGASTVWLVWIFVAILYPIAWPIAWLLDKALGKELPTVYTKKEITMLIEEQEGKSDIKEHEVEMAVQSLSLDEIRVHEVMTPIKNVHIIKHDQILTEAFLDRIHRHGHSRMPVAGKTKRFVGILYVKDLVNWGPSPRTRVAKLMRKNVKYVRESDRLGRVLRLFRDTKTHMFGVKNKQGVVVGIITLEDVIEEITGEIVDEFDRFVDMRRIHGAP